MGVLHVYVRHGRMQDPANMDGGRLLGYYRSRTIPMQSIVFSTTQMSMLTNTYQRDDMYGCYMMKERCNKTLR